MKWYKIASSLPSDKDLLEENKVARLRVAGKVLFLARHNGKYYAGDNKCPHAGAPLHTGWLDECGHIVCPYHRFTFDIETGQNTSGEGYYIDTYPVEIRENGVYVGIPEKSGWFDWLFGS